MVSPTRTFLFGALRLTVAAAAAGALLASCNTDGAKHKAAGNILFKQGDLEGAIREYRAALAVNTLDENAHTLLGNAYFEQQQYDGARAEYEAALARDATARAALEGLAMVELRQARRPAARALYERMVRSDPRDAEAQAALGKLLLAEGNLTGAEEHLRDALMYAQNDRAALYSLGLTLAKKHEQGPANEIFDRLERLAPDTAYAPYGRAVAAAASGDKDEALRWLAVALERGVDELAQVETDDSLAGLRGDERFSNLMSKARAQRAPPKKASSP